jgi:hypothetical protein
MNVADDESATFNSGVVYSADELRMLKKTGASATDLIAIHNVKSIFGGDVEYCPGVPSIPEFTEKKHKVKPLKMVLEMDRVADPDASAVQMSLF